MTCQRRGYQCNCGDCQKWVQKWSRELDAWALIDDMLKGGRSLYSVYERLNCDYPEMLMQYRKIESRFIELAIEKVDLISDTSSKEDGEVGEDGR